MTRSISGVLPIIRSHFYLVISLILVIAKTKFIMWIGSIIQIHIRKALHGKKTTIVIQPVQLTGV